MTQTKKSNQQKKAAPSQDQLFAPVQSQKKKKVRPDKKTSPVDDNEGFEEVGKKRTTKERRETKEKRSTQRSSSILKRKELTTMSKTTLSQ